LATALVGLDEELREIVFRNMSKRAVAFIKEDIRERENAAPATVGAARAFFQRLLDKHEAEYEGGGPSPRDPEPPVPDFGSEEGIISGFCALADFIKRKGPLSLESLTEKLDDPLMRKGLIMLVEGWDPLLIRTILERYKESYLRSMSTKMDLIIEGIDALAAKDGPLVAEQKLRSLVAKL